MIGKKIQFDKPFCALSEALINRLNCLRENDHLLLGEEEEVIHKIQENLGLVKKTKSHLIKKEYKIEE